MTITICHNKPPDRKWGWSVDGVLPRRDGLENLRILKRVSWDWTIEASSWIWAVEDVVGFFFRISTDRDLKPHKMRRTLGIVSIVKIVSLSSCWRTEVKKLINRSYLKGQTICTVCLYLHMYTSSMQQWLRKENLDFFL